MYNPSLVLCFFRGLVDSQDRPLGYTELVPIWYIVGLIEISIILIEVYEYVVNKGFSKYIV